MAKSEYSVLPQNEIDSNGNWSHSRKHNQSSLSTGWKAIYVIVLVVSLTANAFFIHFRFGRPWELYEVLPTKYAHLRKNVPTAITHQTQFSSLNRTEQEAAWADESLDSWNLFIALDEDYTIAQGLPHSQRWPWDDNKGVYIPAAAHEMHCVRLLRIFVNENLDGVDEEEQTWAYPHAIHCLDVLRKSVMCHADDMPMYVGKLHDNVHEKSNSAGLGTIKMCRDWNALLEWSRRRSACYRPIHWGEEGFDELERYKFCPDGTQPWEKSDDDVVPQTDLIVEINDGVST